MQLSSSITHAKDPAIHVAGFFLRMHIDIILTGFVEHMRIVFNSALKSHSKRPRE